MTALAPNKEVYPLPTYPFSSHSLLINQNSSFFLDTTSEGIVLFSAQHKSPLFELKEPILLAQGIAESPNQIHLAYLKATGELCYTIISTTGEHHTTSLGRLDTRNNRYARLILLPLDKVIHIFYATSHLSLPDVWRITHLLWNGQTWKSAQLGEVVHPRNPVYHVLLDSKLNLHLLMMTFLGNRSVLLTNFFNGTYHIWAQRKEALSISREVFDMTALILPGDRGYLFWGSKQPGTDKFEIGFASHRNLCDFGSAWRIDGNSLKEISGPWKGFGVVQSEGNLNLLINSDQEQLFQFNQNRWNLVSSSPPKHLNSYLIQKTEFGINHTEWLVDSENVYVPLFLDQIHSSSPPIENLTLEKPNINDAMAVPVFKNTAPLIPLVANPIPSPELYKPKESETSESALSPESNSSCSEKSAEPMTKLNHIEDTLSSITDNLISLDKKMETLPESLEPLLLLIKQNFDIFSEAIESLKKQDLETLQTLHSLEEKIVQLRQAKEKKGFWEKWFRLTKE